LESHKEKGGDKDEGLCRVDRSIRDQRRILRSNGRSDLDRVPASIKKGSPSKGTTKRTTYIITHAPQKVKVKKDGN
jgi:hypothetical protein